MAPQDPPEVDRWTGKQRRKRSAEKNNGGWLVEKRRECWEEEIDYNIPLSSTFFSSLERYRITRQMGTLRL